MQGSIKKIIEKNGVKYRCLTYIESTGLQYFYSNVETALDVKMQLDIDIQEVGGQNGSAAFLIGLNQIDDNIGRYIARLGNNGSVLSIEAPLGRHTLILDGVNKTFTVDNNTLQMSVGGTPTTTNIAILARRDGTTDSYFVKGKLYGAKLWKNNVLKRDFIPVERISDNKIGMLDLVSGVLSTSQVGDFIKGDYVLVEHIYKGKHKAKTYEKLEYIQTNGSTSYIDTGIFSNDVGYFKLKINGISGKGFFGCYIANYNIFYVNANSGKYRLVVGTKNVENQSNVLLNNDITLEYNNIGSTWAKLNDISLTGVGIGTDTNNSLHLGKLNMNDAQWGITKIYLFEVKDKSGNDLVKLIPVKRLKDDAIGMLDTLTNIFYANAGTGDFTYQSLSTPEYIEEEVEQVDYISATSGAQAINTNVYFQYGDQIQMKMKVDTRVADSRYMGALVSGNGIFVGDSQTRFNFRTSNTAVLSNFIYEVGSIYELDVLLVKGGSTCKISQDGSELQKITSGGTMNMPNRPVHLFCSYTVDGTSNHSKISIYGYKIIRNNETLIDLIPVKYGTEYCMLDLVENKLYHNAGTGNFTGGNKTEVKKINEVVVDNGIVYNKLDYLQSSGTQKIDTNINCNNIGKIEVRFSIQSTIGSGGQMLYGYYHSSVASSRRGSNYLQYTSAGMYIYGGGQNNFSPPQEVLLDHIYKLQIPIAKAGVGYLYDDDGMQRATVNVGATGETGKMTLFVIGGNSTVASHYSYAKIYSFKMYDLNDNLISDLVPCEKKDGTKGMIDLVSHTFYANAGSGTFSGNKKEIILVE